MRGDELEYQATRQGLLKFYLNPLVTDTALSSWSVFEHLVKRQSGRHKHQGGIIIYVLEGEGMTETNGKILEWQEGDLLLLPVQPDGSVHQHWNKDASRGCRWVAFRDLLMARYIANAIDQVLQPEGVAVVIEAAHQCMTTRGVHKTGVVMVTSRMLGAFRSNPATRREFMAMIGNPSSHALG